MLSSVLIANRGEIACRIARTAKRLGMRTIAVYSAADARALHVRLCDEAHCIGPAEPRQSYLSIDRLIEAAVGKSMLTILRGPDAFAGAAGAAAWTCGASATAGSDALAQIGK